MKKGGLKFGDLVWANCDPSVGHEYKGKRPGVVVQSEEQLRHSNLLTFMPLTTNLANVTPDDIEISPDKLNNLKSKSVVKVYCISSFDYERIDKKIGTVDKKVVKALQVYLRKHFGL